MELNKVLIFYGPAGAVREVDMVCVNRILFCCICAGLLTSALGEAHRNGKPNHLDFDSYVDLFGPCLIATLDLIGFGFRNYGHISGFIAANPDGFPRAFS